MTGPCFRETTARPVAREAGRRPRILRGRKIPGAMARGALLAGGKVGRPRRGEGMGRLRRPRGGDMK